MTDRVKDLVSNECHDLVSGEPKSAFDLVASRNLFIHIDSAHKLSILETVSRSLSTSGYPVVGKTETLPAPLKASFDPAGRRFRIYRKADRIRTPR